ncbi:MAG: helicase [Ignavibacteria bacterium]|nr:helicase [Ignavibacteria bacterium]
MPTKFFTNENSNSLYEKFLGVFTYMPNLYAFNAVVGYFRSSGYFSIREHLLKIPKVKILVGINVDHMAAEAQRRGLMFFGEEKKTREEFIKWMQEDIRQARYDKNVEQGILDFMQDITDKKIEIRAHKSKKLHAKIYIFLPEHFNEHSTGLVITGSSNLTNAGLGKNYDKSNYEFNVELRDYEDVKFANEEFEKLWNESTDILTEDFNKIKEKTYLGKEFTPFEIYIKFLIEYFGKSIEYDPEAIGDIPLKHFKKLSYQVDAVNMGFQMLLNHNGFFLADVVGTGKTVVAAMLAKKFILTNGASNTKILIVYPPALEKNWKSTFNIFGLKSYTDFISNGSLEKIINGNSLDYEPKENYDLILVDEAHKFRNQTSQMFQNLQLICKSGRANEGMIEGWDKKIVLISATPLNNRPQDIYHQVSLFQDIRKSTLSINLQSFFGKIDLRYRKIKSDVEFNVQKVRKLYQDIRENVLQPVTIRRTRKDLQNEMYIKDLEEQNIKFPAIEPPIAREYKLDSKLNEIFYKTIEVLTSENGLSYYRYQAIKFLLAEFKQEYENADLTARSLAFILKTQLVKRLESSFYAFRISLNRMRTSTDNMIQMFDKDKVFIAPDLDINKLIYEDYDDEEIEEMILEISEEKPANRTFRSKDFEKEFIEGLKRDKQLLDELCEEWDKIKDDPKLGVFIELMKNDLFKSEINPTGKLVIFSESKDTTKYLTEKLAKVGFDKVLTVSSTNRKNLFDKITENFDANYTGEHKNEYDIIVSTEVLAEGVNLHRANVIVNYDTPWNATRLMQRIGRVNRIGSVAGKIYNFNFYPSDEGEKQIKLKRTAYMKLQGFHSAYGEDSQIYTLEEIIEQFKLFSTGEADEEDVRIKYLEFLRKFRDKDPAIFKEIKNLPLKARTARSGFSSEVEKGKSIELKEHTICYVKEGKRKELYLSGKEKRIYPLTFEHAAKIFFAEPNEKAVQIPEYHYEQIANALLKFEEDLADKAAVHFTSAEKADARTNFVAKMLRELRPAAVTDEFEEIFDRLMQLLSDGTYLNLTTELERIRKKKLKPVEQEKEILKIAKKYVGANRPQTPESEENQIIIKEPEIIISESFI